MKYETKLQIQSAIAKRGWTHAAQVINEFVEALESTDEQKALRADAERMDALQDMFIKGNEFLVRFCTEADIDRRDCDDEDHPHFEAFDWEMAEPVFAKTLRDVIDAAIAAREGE